MQIQFEIAKSCRASETLDRRTYELEMKSGGRTEMSELAFLLLRAPTATQ